MAVGMPSHSIHGYPRIVQGRARTGIFLLLILIITFSGEQDYAPIRLSSFNGDFHKGKEARNRLDSCTLYMKPRYSTFNGPN